jgi:uracil-DNA glycosylase family 4
MIDLHTHSTYSFLDAFGLAPQVLERAEQLGRKAIALTDHDGVWGIPFLEKYNKNGIKLLYGAEMRMIEKISDLKESRTKNHITMIAKNQNGWAKLCNLITRSYDEDHFYYYPTLDIKMMEEGAGDIIIMSGCMSSLVSRSLLNDDLDKAMDVARQFKEVYGKDYYLELIPIENFPDSVSVLATGIRKISQTLNIPIVLTHDVHQLQEGQTDIWKMLHCIKQRKTMEEIEQQTFASDCYQMEDEVAYRSALKTLDGIFSKDEVMRMFDNQERIVADCESYKLKKGMIVKFKNAREILEKKAWEGLASRGLTSQVYKDRLMYELDLITQKDFCDYFLIVSDLTSWAKRTGYLVGSGRGSAAGGLICYVLRITEVDPIFHDIMFERFISVDRMDPPDIDIDFQSSARQDVLHYLYTKYGRDRAAQIGAFSTFGGKNTLDEVGKMYRVPKFEVESLKDKLVTRIGVELRASFTIMDTIEGFNDAKKIAERYPALLNAVKLEGQIRHFGAQAAGAVVNSFPLNYITPLMERQEKHMVFFDGEISKYLNILKIDTLGINALDKINTALDAIGKDYDWLSKTSYEDEKTFKLFNDVDVKGIFQYEKNTGPSLLRQIHIDNFEDLVALNALARPGPLHCCIFNTSIIKYDNVNSKWIKAEIKDILPGDKILSHMTNDKGDIISDNFFSGVVSDRVDTGSQEVFLVRAGRKRIMTTSDHRFLTSNGWKRLKDLIVGEEVYIRSKKWSGTPWNKGMKHQDWNPAMHDRMINDNPSKDSAIVNRRLNTLKTSEPWKKFIEKHNQEMWTEEKKAEHSSTMTEYYKVNPHSNAMRFSNNMVSKPQKALFDYMKQFVSDVELNYPVVTDKTTYYIDIFSPSLNIAIEYDDIEYWHRDSEEFDEKRDKAIIDAGIKSVVRVNKNNIDKFEDFVSSIVHNDLKLEKIKTIESVGVHQTYDLVMENQNFPNYIANGFVVHNSGATQIYTRAKAENNPQAWNNEIMDKITERTHGVIIYQEQTMACGRLLGHMEWEDISHIRTIMSKSMGKEYFEKYRDKFVTGATTKANVTEEFANHVFDHICLLGGTKIICQDKNKIVEKNIEDVKVGDITVSLDRDFSIVYNPVSRIYENATIHLMSVTFDNGVNIKCTPSHPFYVATGFNGMSTNRWIRAMDLSIGDECLYLDSTGLNRALVQSVNFSTLKDWQKVYNLEVEFTHNYFANGINMENCTHGQWSFNRGHSVSYTDISYKMAYLKAHYPRHFYYSLLMNEDLEEKVNGYLRDYIEKGYGRVLPPKLNHSDLRWKLEGNDLRAGLTQVKGLGEKAADQLISLYPIKDMEDLKKRVTKRVVNIRIIRLIEEYKMLTDEEDVDVFGLYDFADRMKNIERSHRMGDITYQFKARPVLLAGFIPMQINQKNLSELEVSVKLKDYSRYNRANGDEFAIFYLRDETGQIQVIVDNKLYPKVKDLLWSCKIGSDILRIKGTIPPSKMFVNLQEVEKYNDQKISGSKCYKCPLAKSDFVPPFGSKTSSIMIVGEAPGKKEVEKGQPFVGRSGSLLGEVLAELGLDRSHLYISNSVFCHPTEGNKNRTPTDEEINCCRGHLEWEIEEIKPKVVVTMGKVPLAAILNKKIEEIKISKMVESVIDLETLSSKYKGVLLIPSYHPAAALYSPDSGYRDSIKNSVKLALEESNKQIKRKAKKEIIT